MTDMSMEGRIRKDILEAAKMAGRIGAHIAPSLSIAEICLAVLQIFDREKDIFVLSKGHGALGYYAAMHQTGMITDDQFWSFEQNGGEFPGQPSRSGDNRIEYSSGSLGMGLSYGVGRAWMAPDATVFVVMGDGELNEGAVWEAAALAAQLKLKNLVAIVDVNGLQSDGKCREIVNLHLEQIWKAYGWTVSDCDGHSVEALQSCMEAKEIDKPKVILAQTVKGKGISFMENNNEWHHQELKEEQFKCAVTELEERYGLAGK